MTTVENEEVSAGSAEDVKDAASKCVTIIFNPVSGQSNPEDRKKRISDALAAHGYRCQYMVTTPEEGAREFARQAVEDGADLVGVSGGDGTVMETMTALIGTGIPVAIFPAGTGNLLSVNLNLPKEVPQAVEAALGGEKRALDLARITTIGADRVSEEPRYFAILAGAGYDGYLIQGADRESKNRLGLGAYFVSAVKNLRHRRFSVAIRLDGAAKPLRVHAKSIMVANMGRLQGGVEVIPDAVPDDGILDIAVLKAETLREWVSLIWSALRRRIRDDDSVDYYTAHKVEIRLSRPQPMQLDGESTDKRVRGFTVEVVPKAVEVMTPKSSPV